MAEILILMLTLICVWGLIRNVRVANFRRQIIDLCFFYENTLDVDEFDKNNTAFEWFLKNGPSYEKMLFSFKPLDIQYWYDQDLINKIFKEDKQ